MHNHLLLLFHADPGGQSATIATYMTMDGALVAETKYVSPAGTNRWEVSLCPADEDIICLLTDDTVNLMRSAGNQIFVFSSFKIYDVTCHVWADDVTQAYGTNDGKIVLYRETVPLEAVELKDLHEKLISSERNDSTTAGVVAMYSSELGMLVCVQSGVLFLFPPVGPADNKKGSKEGGAEKHSRWKNSKVIVLVSLSPACTCSRLHLDETGGQILYGDAESVWTFNVLYAETVCKDGMRLVLVKHASPVILIAVDCTSDCVASVDKTGLVIISSSHSSKVLSYERIPKFVSVIILPGGLKILIATKNQLCLHAILYRKLPKMAIIMNGDNFQAMTADPSNKFIAVVNANVLIVLRSNTLEKIMDIFIGVKEDVLSVKWSLDSVYIGVLTTEDTICLVDTKSESLVWSLDFKLRYFTDISVVGNSILAMGNKFMMSRMHDGREMETVNVHHEAINFKESSSVVISTNKLHFVGTSTGGMVRIDAENMERSTLVNSRHGSPITTINHNINKDQLYVGFEDGQVICFNILGGDNAKETSTQKQMLTQDENCQQHEDYVLCPVDELVRYKTILKELNAERNMIRGQSEQLLFDYRTKKEQELKEMSAELDHTNKQMTEKMKKAEEKFESIEANREEAFARMKQERAQELENQKAHYEKIITDQIRASIEKEAAQKLVNDEVNAHFEAKMTEMNRAFKYLEGKWRKRHVKLEKHLEEISNQLHTKEMELEQAEMAKKRMEEDHARALDEAHQKYFQDQQGQLDASKQLKAHILRLREDNQTKEHEMDELKERLNETVDQLADCRFQLQDKLLFVEKESGKVIDLERRLESRRREYAILNQKLKLMQEDWDKEKMLKTTAQRRLREFDTMISEMSEHIYDRRRLEQSVLAC
uniref:Cilia- and flagella-associated protein 57 n=1 Tax=Ditylenchus dipsaci TaxID=166011 RepID=A0A915DNM1_9BILA